MIEIEDEVGCDTDGREEGVGAAVVAGSDAPPVLEFTEHVFDLVAGLVEFLVEGGLDLSVSLRWYAGLDVQTSRTTPSLTLAGAGDGASLAESRYRRVRTY